MIFKKDTSKQNEFELIKFRCAKGIYQATGLMFFPKKKYNFALIFDRDYEDKVNSSIHMCFVFFPIDVLFLNSKKEIVDIKLNLKPFRFYTPRKPAQYVIELPCSLKNKQFKINSKIKW